MRGEKTIRVSVFSEHRAPSPNRCVMYCHLDSVSLRNTSDSVVDWLRLLLLMYVVHCRKRSKRTHMFESTELHYLICALFYMVRSLTCTDKAAWHPRSSITQESTGTLQICIKNSRDFRATSCLSSKARYRSYL